MSRSCKIIASGRVKDAERQGKAVPEKDLRQLLDSLATSEERYRILVECSPYCIHEIDASGRICSMNPAGLLMANFESESQAIGLDYLEFVSEPDANRITTLMSEAYLGESSEFEFCSRDGSFYQSTFVPIRDQDEKVVRLMGISMNITERKREEKERLRLVEALREKEAQKADSLRVMAGAIAHNFNNELTALCGHLELAQVQLAAGSPGAEFLSEAMKSAERFAEWSGLLLVYVGGAIRTFESVEVNDLLDSCRESLLAQTRGHGTFGMRLPDESVTIHGNRSQLGQLLVALVTNAVEAIDCSDHAQGEDAGQVELVARVCEVQPGDLAGTSEPEARPGRYVRISISDDGCGIGSECLEKLFDPFYTTKFVGRGLGLPVALGIVRGHGGAIGVTSVIGEGTTVDVYFPVERGI